jgi:hypothetical protein
LQQEEDPLRTGINHFFEYIGSKFDKPAKNDMQTYMFTTAYSNLIFTKENVEGIMYPSIPLRGDSFNVAFFPSLIDENKLRLLSVSKNTMRIELMGDVNKRFIEQNSTKGKINYDMNTIIW